MTAKNSESDSRSSNGSAVNYRASHADHKFDDGTGKVQLEAVEISPSDLKSARSALAGVLDGRRSILPVRSTSKDAADRGDISELMRVGEPIEPGTLIATTSGSTGTPKGALLSAQNLRASARSTEQVLREKFGAEPGPWLLALPAHHIAGLQVILRSMTAGFSPVATTAMQRSTAFSVAGFAQDTQALRQRFPREDLHTSLVPSQVHSLLADPQGLAALQEFQAVLIGGAALADGVRKKLADSGIRFVCTYGSSETSGGMVYDGQVLPRGGVRIEDADERGAGRIVLSGPMIARGYRNVDASAAFPSAATFRTSDIGFLQDATLVVLGRADGAINSGGLKVLPGEAEAAIQRSASIAGRGISEACAVGIGDEHWGQALIALVTTDGQDNGHDTVEHGADGQGTEVSAVVRDTLREAAVAKELIPQRTWLVPELPRIGPGKVDRQAVARLVDSLIKGA